MKAIHNVVDSLLVVLLSLLGDVLFLLVFFFDLALRIDELLVGLLVWLCDLGNSLLVRLGQEVDSGQEVFFDVILNRLDSRFERGLRTDACNLTESET